MQRISLPSFIAFIKTSKERFDLWTPLALLGLSLIGLFFIYSAQLAVSGGNAWKTQLVWLCAGAVVYLFVSLIDYNFWLGISHWLYIIGTAMLVAVLLFGAERYGARRWFDFGFFSIQPSEPIKPVVLLVVTGILVRSKVGRLKDSWNSLWKLALAAGVPIFLILCQPDLKSAIVIPPMILAMLYVSKLSTRFFAAAFGVFLLLVGIFVWDAHGYMNYMESNGFSYKRDMGKYEDQTWIPLKDYQRNRIISFIAPERIDPMGIGWNQRQSIISVGGGGLTGHGWTRGTQAQLGYLPRAVAHNDFIVSVIAEEKGFLGSLTVLGLFGIVLFNGVRIAGMARDRAGTLIAIGVTTIFAVHIFINMAMTIGLVPVTGIPLPFISYGGSFVLSCCFLQGLIQSVYRFRKDFR